jgi:hypothetical protein
MRAALCRAVPALALVVVLSLADPASGQSGYYGSIAYSQSTGRAGYSAGRARTKELADAQALRMCRAVDAKVWMWARDQWLALAVVEGQPGNAGFGRGLSANQAQERALAECAKRAQGHGYHVALCLHSGGRLLEEEDLRRVEVAPVESRTGFFAALAFSPSTGKIGSSAGQAATIKEAQALAVKDCDAKDARAFMWGDEWIAIAVAPDRPGVAGFGPGATRAAAEKAALAQCAKYAKGAPCGVALAIYSAGKEDPAVAAAAAEEPPAPPAPPPAPTDR